MWGPLVHPILAEVTPAGHLIRQVTLSQLVVSAVTGLTQGGDGTLWFGINNGRYDNADLVYDGHSSLVHWNPKTGRLAVYPLPGDVGQGVVLDQIVQRGSTIWTSLQGSGNATNSGRQDFLLRFNTITNTWLSPYTVPGLGTIYAWTIAPDAAVVAIVEPEHSTATVSLLELNSRIVARSQRGAWIDGVGARGSHVFVLVAGTSTASTRLIEITAK
jgi:hypothetical protein